MKKEQENLYLHKIYNSSGDLIYLVPEFTTKKLDAGVFLFNSDCRLEIELVPKKDMKKYKIPYLGRVMSDICHKFY